MRGIACALVALAFAATTPRPAAAQCYGPECDRQRSNAPAYTNERPNFHSYQSNGQPYRSAPYEQGQPYRQAPYQGQPYRSSPYEQAQPYRPSPYQGQPYQPAPYHQGQPYQPMPQSQPAYQRPAYQAQPHPPAGYSSVPPGMAPGDAPHGPAHHPEVRTKVTKISRPARSAVRQHPPAPSHTVVRSASRTAGAGQVTISVAEYRDLQNQARELQRLLSTRGGAPNRAGAPNGPSPFPDVGPQGMPPRQ
jgi:hypothetical protein